VLTETELNALAAKLMKAELLGNEEQVREFFLHSRDSLLSNIFSILTHEKMKIPEIFRHFFNFFHF
jgi:hypothetical protein